MATQCNPLQSEDVGVPHTSGDASNEPGPVRYGEMAATSETAARRIEFRTGRSSQLAGDELGAFRFGAGVTRCTQDVSERDISLCELDRAAIPCPEDFEPKMWRARLNRLEQHVEFSSTPDRRVATDEEINLPIRGADRSVAADRCACEESHAIRTMRLQRQEEPGLRPVVGAERPIQEHARRSWPGHGRAQGKAANDSTPPKMESISTVLTIAQRQPRPLMRHIRYDDPFASGTWPPCVTRPETLLTCATDAWPSRVRRSHAGLVHLVPPLRNAIVTLGS
jgi:hypothetical protein